MEYICSFPAEQGFMEFGSVEEGLMEESLLMLPRYKRKLPEAILIVGGYDFDFGKPRTSPDVDVFLPLENTVRSLESMVTPRAHASVAVSDHILYAFGGNSVIDVENAVESYDPRRNQWTQCPPLKRSKTSTAAVSLNGKLFLLGGSCYGNRFSEVEMYDHCVGKWSSAPSMLLKRDRCSAVAFQGAIYAVGGCGKDYYHLQSAERYDPRERSWARIANMRQNRGWHSLVVLKENIYAIGGTDGWDSLSSVEIFDPRMGYWRMGPPMNLGRSEFPAAAVYDSIYAIGGVTSYGLVTHDDIYIVGGIKYYEPTRRQGITRTVECFKEGHGWQTTNLKAMGKRCCCSGVVLGYD